MALILRTAAIARVIPGVAKVVWLQTTAGWGELKASDQGGGQVGVSPVLRAPSAQLSPSLLAKMNVVRGLDIPFYIAAQHGRAPRQLRTQ